MLQNSSLNNDNKIKILVIDDEKGIRNMLLYDLESRGYITETASDGAEGISKVKNGDFNLIISDVKMPKMNGIEVLEQVKKINPHIEVIMTTGYGVLDMAVDCMKKGAYDFVTKPYNMDELDSRIKKALENQRLGYEIVSLKELNRLKSEFLANTSHELRTPMNAIIGYTTLMLENVYGELTEKQSKAVKRISANSSSLLLLINNLLDISKLSAGKILLFIEDFDLAALIEEVTDMMSVLASEKKIELLIDENNEKNVIISSDKSRVKQILINLLGNAIKFTDKGRVVVSLTKLMPANSVKIEVKDTGVGIKTEYLDKIFDEFNQADASSTRKHGGSGLGLSIAKKLVDLLEGEISVESIPEVGSNFIVVLPKKIKNLKSADYSYRITNRS